METQALFEYYIESDTFHFKYAKGEPAVKEQEFHDYHEFVLFLEGTSYFISKNVQKELAPGDLVLIPKEHFHQFCVTQPQNYVRCIFGFRETPERRGLIREVMNELRIVCMPCREVRTLFEWLADMVKSDVSDTEKKAFIDASLIQLLIYMKHRTAETVSQNMLISSLTAQSVAYIDKHFTEALSVEKIAAELYVSPSALAHRFSKELNIPIYRYITKKRLSYAHERIEQGDAMIDAALNSGFNDYSCFYRLYKKHYRQ